MIVTKPVVQWLLNITFLLLYNSGIELGWEEGEQRHFYLNFFFPMYGWHMFKYICCIHY